MLPGVQAIKRDAAINITTNTIVTCFMECSSIALMYCVYYSC